MASRSICMDLSQTKAAVPFGGYVRPPFLLQPALVVALIGFRLLCAAFTATYGNPDEHWQAPEVAHAAVFGTGFATWEVRPENKLRSGGHALLLAVAYRTAVALGITSPSAISAVPRVVHALLAAATDAAVMVLALRIFGSRPLEARAHTRAHARAVAVWALFAHMCSWFVAYMGGRPVVNSLESALFAVGLANWMSAYAAESSSAESPPSPDINDPQGMQRSTRLRRLAIAGLMAGLAVGVRPTAALPWCALGLHFLCTQPLGRSLGEALPAAGSGALAGLLAASGADWWLYGAPALPLLSFLRFNLLAGLDAFYGAYPPAWYLYDGVPAVVAAFLPLLAIGIAALSRPARQGGPLLAALATVAGLSAAAHKEHRFLLPLTPIAALYAGRGLWEVLQHFPPPKAVHRAVVAVARAAFSDEPEEKDAERDTEVDEAELPSLAAELVLEGQAGGQAAGQAAAQAAAPAAGSESAADSAAAPASSLRKRRQASTAASAVLAASAAAAAAPSSSSSPPAAASAASVAASAEPVAAVGPPRQGGEPAENWHGARRTRPAVVPLHTPPPASSSPASAALHALRQCMPQRLAGACPAVGLLLLLAVNVCLFAYFGCIHQRGAVSVARALRDDAALSAGTLLQVPPVHVALLSEAASQHPVGASIQRDEAAAVPHGMAALAAVLSRHQGVRTPPASLFGEKHNGSAASAAFADAFRRRVLQHGLRLPLAAFASAHYLMQCHSAPFHATVHSPLMQLTQLDCSPPLPPGGLLGSNGTFSVDKVAGGSDRISEAALWQRDPAALLHALYGPQPAAPLLCTLTSSNGTTAAAAAAADGSARPLTLKTAVSVHHDPAAAVTVHRQFQEVRQLLDTDQRQHSSLLPTQRIPEGLAVHPAALAAAAAAPDAAPPAGGPTYRALPTHIVMFDSDAARPAVTAFLRQNAYLPGSAGHSGEHTAAVSTSELAQSEARDFFFAFHGADAHRDAHSAGGDPSRVLLLEHPCWRAARRT